MLYLRGDRRTKDAPLYDIVKQRIMGMNLLKTLQAATGLVTLASVIIIAFMMAKGHRRSARRLSGFVIAILIIFAFFTLLVVKFK